MELMSLGKEVREEGGLPYLVSVVEQEDWLSLLAKCPESQGSALSKHTFCSFCRLKDIPAMNKECNIKRLKPTGHVMHKQFNI